MCDAMKAFNLLMKVHKVQSYKAFATSAMREAYNGKEVAELISNSKKIYSVENHFKVGGLGDLISDTFNVIVHRIGMERKFLTGYGSYNDLRKESNMDKNSIINQLKWV